ncbi:MAG: glycerophosphoryl diester phosphodiesterase membrane domain-containing protein [Solobacterium sp.]|jgi:glycerophosphoryl diester phosphodiesterase|nr:glycerophosphoryl diester phosphodiesterase membrane domain-containing protein [Solobacterium sp.]MCH4222479.1 glycerophosphoryl diester phosphodiesterase membrane domain-containing protein [Solobacterium sp.]MCH4266085.1 glycerophosphoryl diester phosphodiesterase membrane domain-containing protein [Solobacterium sp.]
MTDKTKTDNSKAPRQTLHGYVQCFPGMLKYQIVTKALMTIILLGLHTLIMLALKNTGRIALTSGDSGFLFSTWQGWLIILLFALMVIICVSLDINAKIINSANIIEDTHDNLFVSIIKGFKSISHFICPWGFLVIAYVSFVVPIIGIGFTSSLTENFKIPAWIFAGYVNQAWWPYAKAGVFLLLAFFGVKYVFTLHFVILGHEKVKQAMDHSAQLVKNHLIEVLFKYVLFAALGITAAVAGIYWLMAEGPFYLFDLSSFNLVTSRFITIFFYCTADIVYVILTLLITPTQILILTKLWYRFKGETNALVPVHEKKKHPVMEIVIFSLVIADLVVCFVGANNFATMFPSNRSVGIVAHRLGGNLGPENTLEGMKNADATGVWGNELDVERTKDGYYIVNHDDTFQRVAGLNKKPSDLTLEEIKTLTVKDSFDKTRPSTTVSTLDEILDEGKKNGQYLFVELKGQTADTRMADDVVQMIKDKGMENQCVIMSLKYKLMNYTETTYPEMNTGYIYSYAYGDQAEINVDSLILEVTTATSSVINEIHAQNKKVYVWTVDTETEMNHFLDSEADAIITNKVVQAEQIQTELNQRTDKERVQAFFTASD